MRWIAWTRVPDSGGPQKQSKKRTRRRGEYNSQKSQTDLLRLQTTSKITIKVDTRVIVGEKTSPTKRTKPSLQFLTSTSGGTRSKKKRSTAIQPKCQPRATAPNILPKSLGETLPPSCILSTQSPAYQTIDSSFPYLSAYICKKEKTPCHAQLHQTTLMAQCLDPLPLVISPYPRSMPFSSTQRHLQSPPHPYSHVPSPTPVSTTKNHPPNPSQHINNTQHASHQFSKKEISCLYLVNMMV